MKCQKYLLIGSLLLAPFLSVSGVAFADVNASISDQGIRLAWSHATESEIFRSISVNAHVPIVFESSFVDTAVPDGAVTQADSLGLLKFILPHTNYAVTGNENNPVIHVMSMRDWPGGIAAPESAVTASTNDTEDKDNSSSVERVAAVPPTMNQPPKYGSQPATSAAVQMQQVQNQRGNQYNYNLYSLICKCSP